jgi:hypothetical protein
MNTAAARARGESISRKHVDFSLGMRDVSSMDVMGDVFEGRSRHIDEVVRLANRENDERRIQEAEEEEEEERRSRASLSKTRTSNSGHSVHAATGSDGRRSTDSHGGHSISSISRNRFFRHRTHPVHEEEDMMEQGRSDIGPALSQIRTVSPSARSTDDRGTTINRQPTGH